MLEVLREPLESGRITISRAARQAEFPARFQLIAAMNPCPCGYLGHPSGRCRCSADQIQRYRARLSGPLLDRIDMHVEVPSQPREHRLAEGTRHAESSAQVRARVVAAHALAQARGGRPNARLGNREVARDCRLHPDDAERLDAAIERLGLSARARHRVLKVARTIADLSGAETIAASHLMEALSYRRLDRPVPR